MIFYGLVGMKFDTEGIEFHPVIPEEYNRILLTGLHYRRMIVDIEIHGHGTRIREFLVNGNRRNPCRLYSKETGSIQVMIAMEQP